MVDHALCVCCFFHSNPFSLCGWLLLWLALYPLLWCPMCTIEIEVFQLFIRNGLTVD